MQEFNNDKFNTRNYMWEQGNALTKSDGSISLLHDQTGEAYKSFAYIPNHGMILTAVHDSCKACEEYVTQHNKEYKLRNLLLDNKLGE